MAKLSGPYEIFDIGDGEAVQVRVKSYELGDMEIHPGYGTAVKSVEGLRLQLDHAWVEGRLPYLDITSGRLRVQLLPFLTNLPAAGKLFRITKRGVAPAATFTIEALP